MSSIYIVADYGEQSASSEESGGAPTRGRPKGRTTKAKPTASPKATKTTKTVKAAKAAKPVKATRGAGAKTTKVTRATKAAKPVKGARVTKTTKVGKSALATKPAKAKTVKVAKPAKAVRGAKPAKATKTKAVKAPSSRVSRLGASTKVAKPKAPRAPKEPKRVDGRRRSTKKVLKVLPLPNKAVIAAIQEPNPSGQAIKDFRVGIGVNMRAFAELLGVNPATVFRWETERTERIQSSSQQKLKSLVNKVINEKPIKIAG
ncbi:MAG: hypothetical protein LBR11_10515 [Deltaproteobacteria bacterium]|jgi:DNA-binding transcriptional regulator YiaG|nr:hypothetical protein [Deltaproteobacteria bacterium]